MSAQETVPGQAVSTLESSLDLVDHLEPPDGVPVRVGPFLTNDAAAVVQQHRSITALHILRKRLGRGTR
jgi:hypothetical protein